MMDTVIIVCLTPGSKSSRKSPLDTPDGAPSRDKKKRNACDLQGNDLSESPCLSHTIAIMMVSWIMMYLTLWCMDFLWHCSGLFSALFEAVEHQDMERARMMLDSNGLDVNRWDTLIRPQRLLYMHPVSVFLTCSLIPAFSVPNLGNPKLCQVMQ